ncbi:MAG: DUF1326 domain-containing protein [Alphaproteobacteria bacterium]
MAQVSWRIKGVEYANCNCAYGCPCQFNALPTHGDCQYVLFARIDEGHYGDTRLDGLRFAVVGKFPGAVHEGNGTQQLIIEEGADDKQREALRRIVYNEDTDELRTHYAIYNAMSSTVLDPVFAPIEPEVDMEARTARGRVPGLVVSDAEPIRNPVTGDEHRAQIVLPHGFEYTVAEMGSASSKMTGDIPLEFSDTYAQFNELHMTENGVVR